MRFLQPCVSDAVALAERNVDVSSVQTVDRPTRDVLVVYDSDGDRQFVGFGGPNDSFADCYISADQLPVDTLTNCAALVTGTLGLAFPSTAAAMHKAVESCTNRTCCGESLWACIRPIAKAIASCHPLQLLPSAIIRAE